MNTAFVIFTLFALVLSSVQAYSSIGVSFKYTDENCTPDQLLALDNIPKLVAVSGGYSDAEIPNKLFYSRGNNGRELEEADSPTRYVDDFMTMINRQLGDCDCIACILCQSGAGYFCGQCPCCNGNNRRLRGETPALARELEQDLNGYAKMLCQKADLPCVDCFTATVMEQ